MLVVFIWFYNWAKSLWVSNYIIPVSIFQLQQICHRDLKLENVLLDGSPAPRLKICDFGYSKVCCQTHCHFSNLGAIGISVDSQNNVFPFLISHQYCIQDPNQQWGRQHISHQRCYPAVSMMERWVILTPCWFLTCISFCFFWMIICWWKGEKNP